jgi:hypothetical protein
MFLTTVPNTRRKIANNIYKKLLVVEATITNIDAIIMITADMNINAILV